MGVSHQLIEGLDEAAIEVPAAVPTTRLVHMTKYWTITCTRTRNHRELLQYSS